MPALICGVEMVCFELYPNSLLCGGTFSSLGTSGDLLLETPWMLGGPALIIALLLPLIEVKGDTWGLLLTRVEAVLMFSYGLEYDDCD